MELSLRPMSTSQVLDRTFFLYRNNFILFAGIAIITPALKLIAMLIQLRIFGPLVMPQQPENMTPQFMQVFAARMVITVAVGSVIYLFGTALASSATAYAVSAVHLGKTTSIVESYRHILPIFWRILWLLCLLGLIAYGPLLLSYAIMIGLVILVPLLLTGTGQAVGLMVVTAIAGLIGLVGILGGFVWILYALARYALAVAACTLEKLPASNSLRRSTFLSKGTKWGILGIGLLTTVLSFVLTYALQLPALLINNSMFMTGKTHLSMAATGWIYFADFLGGTIAGPIMTIAFVLVYYDQRVRKEAFDLQLMMEAVGQQAQPQAAAAPPALG
jgi:hypothetical protein